MKWTEEKVKHLIEMLRARNDDTTEVEVKRAQGGLPANLGTTLSAFGNMPEGGTLVLGLDEKTGFTPVHLTDPAQLEKGVASIARTALQPPVHVDFEQVLIDGATTLFCTVSGLPLSSRPCRFRGKAYLRQADGDYELSEQELQQIETLKLVDTQRPRWDSQAVDGTTRDDLDQDLTRAFVRDARTSSSRLAEASDELVLRRRRVLEPHGDRLTLAGLYALGAYPQQFSPSLSITCAVELPPEAAARTKDLRDLDGPLPDLLDEALEWVRRNASSQIVYTEEGHARNLDEFPGSAVRELIANALVHRDLGPATSGKRVEIRLNSRELVINNPGGLHGITVDQLGDPRGKSAVNEFLYDIAKLTRTRDGERIIEGEGGGIREVRRVLTESGQSEPTFYDFGVGFTALIPRNFAVPAQNQQAEGNYAAEEATAPEVKILTRPGDALPTMDVDTGFASLSRHGQRILDELTTPQHITELGEKTGLTKSQLHYALRRLIALGLVEMQGRQGKRDTAYARVNADGS